MTRDRLPNGPTLQRAYGVLDKYQISRTFFIKTDQNNCETKPPALEAYDPTTQKPVENITTEAIAVKSICDPNRFNVKSVESLDADASDHHDNTSGDITTIENVNEVTIIPNLMIHDKEQISNQTITQKPMPALPTLVEKIKQSMKRSF